MFCPSLYLQNLMQLPLSASWSPSDTYKVEEIGARGRNKDNQDWVWSQLGLPEHLTWGNHAVALELTILSEKWEAG